MKAIAVPNFGGPEALRIEKVPLPQIRPDDLLVRVYAAGVNRADHAFRKGGCERVNFGDSETIGSEVAAEAQAVGVHAAKSSRWGDRLMGIVGGGGYAEFAHLNAGMAILLPAGLTFAEAAAIPETFVSRCCRPVWCVERETLPPFGCPV